MRRVIIALVCLLATAPVASADQLPAAARAQLQEFLKNHNRDDLVDLTGTDFVSTYILERIIETQPDRISVSDIRQDLQGGSLSPRAGGTSIIARPSITDLLSAALESGAIGRKTNDKSATFSVNALPLRQLLGGELPRGCGSLDADCEQGAGRWLRGLSASLTFSPSTVTTAVPETGGTAPALSIEEFRIGGRILQAATVRYEMFVRERRTAELEKALDAAAAALQERASAFLKTEAPFQTALGQLLDAGWKPETIALLERNTQSPERLEQVLLERYRVAYEVVRGNAALEATQNATIKETLAYMSAQNAVLAEKLYRKALTVDYVHERPTDQPTLHQVRLVFATPLGRKAGALTSGPTLAAPTAMLTVNGGFSLFDPQTSETSTWKVRDSHFSLGLDWSPRMAGRFRPTYTAAYYFQYMVANGVLQFTGEAVTPGGAAIALPKSAKELLDTKGPIHIGQVRASFPVGEGVSFPVAFSYSNRSELIKGRSFWQGHFGVSYDFSQLTKQLQKSK